MPIRSFIAMLLLAPLTLAQETAPPLFAADTPIIDYQNPQLPDYGRIGMVVSPEKGKKVKFIAGDQIIVLGQLKIEIIQPELPTVEASIAALAQVQTPQAVSP